MLTVTDGQLVNQYLKGDEVSLEILIKKYLKQVYNFIYRYVNNSSDAEDITQEVFVKTWRNLKKFDQNKSFKPWLFTIAKNTCFDFFKKKKFISLSLFEDYSDKLVDSSASPSKLINSLDAQQKIIPAMGKLSPQYRLVLHLYYHDQLNFREISEKLNESINTIKSRYRRALVILKEDISEV
jgi:RNA polymerase sigma-70 factor, ECF subfamily